MITIGLHGRMASGKSTVARRFGELGGHVVDADAIAHEVLEEPEAKAEIVARFGAGVLGAGGRIDRARLGSLVFGPTAAHAAALADLERIVHPRVHRRIERALAAIDAAAALDGPLETVAVLDVPLLVKAGWDRVCDAIVHVECADGSRRERLARRGIDAAQQAARDAAWEAQRSSTAGPDAARPGGRTTFTVDTSGDLAYTLGQVDRIWHTLTGR